MKHKRIITLSAAIVLTFAVTTPADAQFGNVLNKAKKAVKEKVKEKSEEIKEKATEKVTGTVGTSTTGTLLSNTMNGQEEKTVFSAGDGPTVSLSQLFPYQPKEKFMSAGLYLDGTTEREDYILYIYSQVANMITGAEGYPRGAVVPAACGMMEGETKFVAYGEPVVNAFFWEYFQKPDDYKCFRQMIKASVVAEAYFFNRLRQNLVEGSETQMKDSKGETLTLWEPEIKRRERGHLLMMEAGKLAARSKYENVFESTYSIYTQAEKAYKEGNNMAAFNNYRELKMAWNNFLTTHPGWENDSRASEFTTMYNAAMKHSLEVRDILYDELKEPMPMPPTFKGIAGIEDKIRRCIATEDPEHKNAPIVYLSEGWRPLYRSGSTSIIDQRAVDVGWTYTDAKGQKWLAYTTFMQKAVYNGLTVTYVNQFMFSGGYKTMKLK